MSENFGEKSPLHEDFSEHQEKPPFVYHGSPNPNIEEFEPHKRYTPGAMQGQEIPPAIYAGDDPGYAAAHGFAWGSSEGMKLGYHNEKLILEVPKEHVDRIEHKVYVYKLPSGSFELLDDVEPWGHNYWSKVAVKPVEPPQEFTSVRQAVEHFGGEVKII